MIVKLGTYNAHIEAVKRLMVPHWEEVAKHKDRMVLAPDWDKYAALDDQGKLFVVYIFTDDYELIGYSYNFLDTHIHYKDLVVASNDAIYVSPEHRNSPAGLRLIKATKATAKVLGADLMLWHAKQGSALDKLFIAKRLQVQDTIYSEPL